MLTCLACQIDGQYLVKLQFIIGGLHPGCKVIFSHVFFQGASVYSVAYIV